MSEIQELRQKFDNHIAIYAANGKESKRVADLLEKLIMRADERDKKTDEMYSLYTEGKLATKIAKLVFALTMALGGAYLLFKNVLKV